FKVLLTIEKDGQFLGATWFLGALFLTSIIYKLIDTYIKNSKFKPFVMLLLSVTAGITGFTITFDHMLSRVLVLSMFFGFGVFVKTYIENFKSVDCCALAIVSALIFLIIGKYNSANMNANQYRYPLLFVVGAVGASYALLYFCRWIDMLCKKIHVLEYIKNIGTFFGRNSLDILIWQFVAFRLVILLQMYKWHNPITWDELLSHYPVYVVGNGWWIIYTIVGMVVPVLFCSLLRAKPLGYITRKIHIV
ncbi:MAG: acyltransferase family protein, partial [Coprococcus sp.]